MDKKDILLMGLRGRHTFSPAQVQKLFFLIDENLEQRVKKRFFDFQPCDYGPFDKSVYIELEKLRDEGLVEISSSDRPSSRCYQLTVDGDFKADEIARNFNQDVVQYIESLSDFVRTLSFRELVAAIYDAYPGMKINSVFFDK